VTQQLTQQELADGAARWACRTWVSGSHGLPRSWGRTWMKWQHHGGRMWEHNWGALQATEIMENIREKVPHYVLKNRSSWVSLAAHILDYK